MLKMSEPARMLFYADAHTFISSIQTIAPTLQKRRMRAARHKLLKLYAVKTAHRLGGETVSRPMFESKGVDSILEPGRAALSRQIVLVF